MGQECPHCRLISPDGALRCDCGYDFTAKTMKGSYLLAHLVEKGGGEEKIAKDGARSAFRTAAAVLVLTAVTSGVVSLLSPHDALESGRTKYIVVLVGFTSGAILLLWGLYQRRFGPGARISGPDRSENAPGSIGYHQWLGQLNTNPLALGIRGCALVFAGAPVTLVLAVLGLVLFPSGQYPTVLLALPGLIAALIVIYALGFAVYKLPPAASVVLCGAIGAMSIWIVLTWARLRHVW